MNKAGLVGSILCQSGNDYKSGCIFYGLLLAPRIKYKSTRDNIGNIPEHKTLEGFSDSERLIYRSQNFQMIEGNKNSAMLPKS